MARTLTRASNQYFTVDSSPTSSGVLTLACFAKWSGTTGGAFGDQRVFLLGDSGSDNIRMSLILNEGTPGWRYQSFNTNQALITSSAINAGQWYHVAGVRASTTSHTLYVDGSSAGTDSTGVTSPTTNRVRIGQYPTASYDQSFDGDVAELAMWDTDLSAAELVSLAKGFSPLRIRPESLVFYAPFIRGTDEADIVGGLTLTATASPTVGSHPRVIRPRNRRARRFTTAAGGGGGVVSLQHIYRHVAGIGA